MAGFGSIQRTPDYLRSFLRLYGLNKVEPDSYNRELQLTADMTPFYLADMEPQIKRGTATGVIVAGNVGALQVPANKAWWLFNASLEVSCVVNATVTNPFFSWYFSRTGDLTNLALLQGMVYAGAPLAGSIQVPNQPTWLPQAFLMPPGSSIQYFCGRIGAGDQYDLTFTALVWEFDA